MNNYLNFVSAAKLKFQREKFLTYDIVGAESLLSQAALQAFVQYSERSFDDHEQGKLYKFNGITKKEHKRDPDLIAQWPKNEEFLYPLLTFH